MSRYFIDSEFAEAPGQIDLISIALVCEDGREFYAVLSEGWSEDRCNAFVKEHVLPNLGDVPRDTRENVRKGILEFVDDKPEFWGYFADYDWVAFCWLFGAMIDLPKGWPMYCRDMKQVADELNVRLPYRNDTHNCLNDARDMLSNWKYLEAKRS